MGLVCRDGGGVAGMWGKQGGYTSAAASYDLLNPRMISLVTYVPSVLNVTKVFVNPKHVGEKQKE